MANDDGGVSSDEGDAEFDDDEIGDDDGDFGDGDDYDGDASSDVADSEDVAGKGEASEATSSQAAAPKKRSVRNVPRETLEASVGHVDKLFDAFGETASVEALAALLGHDAPRGGAWKTRIGTLRAYGLVIGSDPVQLTEIGQKVVRADQPEVQLQARRQALVASAPFRELHETYVGRSLPDEENLATKCRFAFRLKQDGALEVARDFASSLKFAGLIGPGGVVLPLDGEQPSQSAGGFDHVGDATETEEESDGEPAGQNESLADLSNAGEPSLPLPDSGPSDVRPGQDGDSHGADPHDDELGTDTEELNQPSVELTVRLIGYSGPEVVRILRTIGYRDAAS